MHNRLFLLLVVLFLSGCSTIVDFVSGRKGTFLEEYRDGGEVVCSEYIFEISADGDIYIDEKGYELAYLSSNGTDCMTFKRFYDDGTVITIVLSDITSYTGIRTLYNGYIKEQESGFVWNAYSSN